MKKIVYILPVLFCYTLTWAQNISFQASGPGAVRVGEQFYVTYSINAEGTNFKEPDLSNFEVLSGPNPSKNSSVQIINGNVSQSFNLSFTYVIRATKEGKFTIGPASIDYKKNTYSSNQLSIEVVQREQAQTSSSGNTNPAGSQPNTENVSSGGKDVFIKLLVDKTRVYQGEAIPVSLKIYSKVNIASLNDLELPNLKDFFKQDIETPQLDHLEKENVNGDIFYTGLIQRFVIFPLKSGDLVIDKASLTAIVQKRVSRSQNFFDDFFPSYQNVQIKLASDPIHVNVLPLPSNKPNSFDGAVGSFTLSANLSKEQCQTNEAVTLKLSLSGKGNLKLISSLKVNLPNSLETYEPKVNSNYSNTSAGQSGSVDFEYLFIPRHVGEYTIPPIEFSYFDPSAAQYKTLKTQAFTLSVSKGTDDTNNTVSSGFSKEEIKYIGSDIRHIKTKTSRLGSIDSFVLDTIVYKLIFILIILLFISTLLIYKKQIKANADITSLKKRRARKLSKKRLKLARVHMKANNTTQFYIEIEKALWGYLSDKLSIPAADLSKENSFGILKKRGVEDTTLEELSLIIDQCEFARYAPGNEQVLIAELYNKTMDLLDNLQEEIR